MVAPLYYEGAVRRSLLRYKFQGVSSLAEAYGPLVAGKVAGFPDLAFDRITWVPLSRRRERRRGYDQARLLAEVVARSLEREAEPLLEKVRTCRPNRGPAPRRNAGPISPAATGAPAGPGGGSADPAGGRHRHHRRYHVGVRQGPDVGGSGSGCGCGAGLRPGIR